jgi:cellulose synthase/poly-beta-1,6-N-acetylglucosamine synthase-like glycosyltransferase
MIFILICIGSYSIFMSLLMIGWYRSVQNYQKAKTPTNYPSVTVIIALRNEESRVDTLLQSLIAQNYPSHLFKIICVDDSSTDGTVAKVDAWVKQYDFISRVEPAARWSHYKGKKRLLQSAIDTVTTEWVVTTDADCVMEEDWLFSMLKQSDSMEFISGPVAFTTDDSIFQNAQQIEFSSLVGAGLSCIGLKKPLMCNGANLAFRTSAFVEVKGYEGNEMIASGDDEFLMHKIQQRFPRKVGAALSKNSIVRTAPNSTWSQFYHQRKRWAGKWGKYQLNYVNLLAMWVFVYQIILLCSLPLLLLGYLGQELFFGLWISRFFWDFFYLQIVTRFLSIRLNIVIFIGIVVLYPLYAVWFGLVARWGGYQWKGREVHYE